MTKTDSLVRCIDLLLRSRGVARHVAGLGALMTIAWAGVFGGSARGQELLRAEQAAYEAIIKSIAEAQQREDQTAVNKFADEAKLLLGARAGVPDEPEDFREPPAQVEQLSLAEVAQAFNPYFSQIMRDPWWRINGEAASKEHALRDTASVALGCLYAQQAGCEDGDKLLSAARDAADYLLRAQEQGGRGLFPFPAESAGQGNSFAAAQRFLERAQRAGKLDEAVHDGWIVDDLGDGGLQFDNGVCGVAMLEMYAATQDAKYLKAAELAGKWAMKQPVVPNWNYNSFSVYLLAELARATGDRQWLDAAVKKAKLGVYPGQLREGPHEGRWFDGHNARLPYHYILVRSLISLASALEETTPERKQADEALVRAMKARNVDFVAKGVGNADSALEALLLLRERFPNSDGTLGRAGQTAALAALEKYCVAKFRANSPPVAPAVWGQFLRDLSRSEKAAER